MSFIVTLVFLFVIHTVRSDIESRRRHNFYRILSLFLSSA